MVVALTSQGCRVNENNDSGYVASNIEETMLQGSPPDSSSKLPNSENENECNKTVSTGKQATCFFQSSFRYFTTCSKIISN